MVLHLRQDKETLRFVNLPQPPRVSLFRQFSAPVRLVSDESSETLAFLLGHDSDPFNRWDAGQRLAERLILQGVRQSAALTTTGDLRLLTEAFAAILQDNSLDQGLAAKLLELPSELYLGQQMQEIDVEGIHGAREQVRKHLATALHKHLEVVRTACENCGPYSTDPEEVGRRSLKNRCLYYLYALSTEQTCEVVSDSYRSATNMTDRIAALALLVDSSGPLRQPLLDDFFGGLQATLWCSTNGLHCRLVHDGRILCKLSVSLWSILLISREIPIGSGHCSVPSAVQILCGFMLRMAAAIAC